MLNFSVTIVPAICCLLTMIAFMFYDLNDEKHVQIREELDRRRRS